MAEQKGHVPPFYIVKVSPLLLNISPMEEKDSASARMTGHAKAGAVHLGHFCSFSALVAACTISYVKVCALYVVDHYRACLESFDDKLTLLFALLEEISSSRNDRFSLFDPARSHRPSGSR